MNIFKSPSPPHPHPPMPLRTRLKCIEYVSVSCTVEIKMKRWAMKTKERRRQIIRSRGSEGEKMRVMEKESGESIDLRGLDKITQGPFASILIQALPFGASWSFRKKWKKEKKIHPSWPIFLTVFQYGLRTTRLFTDTIRRPSSRPLFPASSGHIRYMHCDNTEASRKTTHWSVKALQMFMMKNSRKVSTYWE